MPFIIDAVYSYTLIMGLLFSIMLMTISAGVACGGVLLMTLGKWGWGITSFLFGSFFTYLLFHITSAIMKGVL